MKIGQDLAINYRRCSTAPFTWDGHSGYNSRILADEDVVSDRGPLALNLASASFALHHSAVHQYFVLYELGRPTIILLVNLLVHCYLSLLFIASANVDKFIVRRGDGDTEGRKQRTYTGTDGSQQDFIAVSRCPNRLREAATPSGRYPSTGASRKAVPD